MHDFPLSFGLSRFCVSITWFKLMIGCKQWLLCRRNIGSSFTNCSQLYPVHRYLLISLYGWVMADRLKDLPVTRFSFKFGCITVFNPLIRCIWYRWCIFAIFYQTTTRTRLKMQNLIFWRTLSFNTFRLFTL